MSDEDNKPDLAAIEAQVRAKLEAEFNEEKNKIIGNRDQILEEKKALESKYKGFDQEKIEGYQKYLKELENNEEMRLMSEGKIDEVIQRKMSGREKAWSETQAEYEQRLTASQESADGFKAQLEELQDKNLSMQKRQYFKDLTGKDDSFKADYFNDYFALQSKNVDIDQDTGAVYALGADGKRKVDTDGNFVKFEEDYAKQKVNHGLFWNGGSGSGTKSGSGSASGIPFSKMTSLQKIELKRELGESKYGEFVREQLSKK